MSAANVLVQRSCVHLMTDGAHYQPDGKITAIGPKVRAMPHVSCAVAMRGAAVAMPPFMEEISAAASSFDSLRERMAALLQTCQAHYRHLLDQCSAGSDFEIVVVGISESEGPAAYLVASHTRYGKPWEVVPLQGFVPLPCDEAILTEIQHIMPSDAESIDPSRVGLAVLEIQRSRPRLSNGDLCIVGGFAQLTTVTREAVTSRVIHRWPDVVGQRVGASEAA